MKQKWVYILVPLIVFLAYANTLNHEFVWDDQIVITLNNVTNEGLDGLKEIWTTKNYIQDRPTYRPIPQTYFAALWEFFPNNPFPFHLGTVLLYAFCSLSFLIVLKRFFPLINNWILFLIGLYFALLPVHTEVVANSKSSDEILSAIFVLWSFYFAQKKSFKNSLLASFLFALALLSKVSAITVFPILLFILIYNNEIYANSLLSIRNILIKGEKLITIIIFLCLIALTAYFNSLYTILAVPLIFILAWYALNELKSYFSVFIILGLMGVLLYFKVQYIVAILFFYALIIQHKDSVKSKNIPLILLIVIGSILVVLAKIFLGVLVLLSLYVFYEFSKSKKINFKILLVSVGIPTIIIFAYIIITKKGIESIIPFLIFLPATLLILKQYAPKLLFPLIFTLSIAFDFYSNGNYHQDDLAFLFGFKEISQQQMDVSLDNNTDDKRIFTNEPYHNILVAAPSNSVKMATILRIQLIYLQKMLFPIHLVHQHGTWQVNFASWKDWDVYVSILVHLALLYMLFMFYKKQKYLLFWSLLWYLLSISIYTNIIRLMPDTLAERFLFLPSLGFSVFVIVILDNSIKFFIKNKTTQKYALSIALVPLLVYYSYKVFNRNKAWKSNYTLSAQTLPYAQNNAAINAQYAVELRNLIKYNLIENKDSVNALAIKHYNKSIEIFPDFYGPYSDLAIYYILDANPDKAFPYLVKATELKPEEWIHQYYLGLIYYERKKYSNAISSFESVIKNNKINKNPTENPELKEAYEYAARCYYNKGNVDKAAEKLEEVIGRFNVESSYILLANIYRKSGKRDEAISVYRRLLKQEPNNQELINTIQYLEEGLIY